MFVTSLILFIKELMDKFFKSLNELPTFKNELITSFNLLIITLMSFSISTNSLSSGTWAIDYSQNNSARVSFTDLYLNSTTTCSSVANPMPTITA